MKKQRCAWRVKLALAGALISATSLAAAVALETPITYAKNAEVSKRVRSECRVEDELEKLILASMEKANKGKRAMDANTSVLRVEVAQILGVSDDAYDGPKVLSVNATLTVNGKVQRQGRVSQEWSGRNKGTCPYLNRTAKTIAKDLDRWVKDAKYVMPTAAARAKGK